MADLVLVKQREQIVEIILNRPDKLNAGNWGLMEALDAALDEVTRMNGVRVALLRGEGRAFCAGIDLTAFEELIGRFGEHWRENLFPLTEAFQGVLNKIEQLTIPVIGVLHGYAIGLGCEIALACDMRIAAEGTKLGLPEAKLGLIPDVGGTTRLTRLVGPARAKEFIMTGKNIPLDKAEQWGVVNAVVPQENLLEQAEALAQELCEAAPLAVNYAKRVINGIADIQRGLQLEAWAQSVLMRSEDFMTGAQAAMTKTKPEWRGK
ncbi:MAG: enoyl-CoA hydratase/isomerase family protein [Chloroflexi bacterium]|nr:MAG: enoyl-CoA hydratase/isomerase family protein [Chloroflexota bacterium]